METAGPERPQEDEPGRRATGRPPRKSGSRWLPRSRWGDLPMVGPFGGLIMTALVLILVLMIYLLLLYKRGNSFWAPLHELWPF